MILLNKNISAMQCFTSTHVLRKYVRDMLVMYDFLLGE